MCFPELKTYKTPALLASLQRDGIIPKHKEFPQNNPANKQPIGILRTLVTYTLHNYIFKEIQRHWPKFNQIKQTVIEVSAF